MYPKNKSLILFILFLWFVFAAWEMDAQAAEQTLPNTYIRLDLLMLPFLIILTGYAIYILIRNHNFDNSGDTEPNQEF